MAEGAFGLEVLQKLFPDNAVFPLASLMQDEGESPRRVLPPSLQQALAVQLYTDLDFPQQMAYQSQQYSASKLPPSIGLSQRRTSSERFEWYPFMESCKSVLLKRALGRPLEKWQLPCMVARDSIGTACESPFLPHVSREDWEALHELLGPSMTRFVLTHCMLFVLVEERIWLQVSGALGNKGRLEVAFPPRPYNRAALSRPGNSSERGKRKRAEEHIAPACMGPPHGTPAHTSQQLPSILRPLKKIRFDSSVELKDRHSTIYLSGPSLGGCAVSMAPPVVPSSSSSCPTQPQVLAEPPTPVSSILKPLKKVREVRLNAKGEIVEHLDSPAKAEPPPPVPLPEKQQKKPIEDSSNLIQVAPQIVKKKRRTRRKKKEEVVRQRIDKRRALLGSDPIPHDAIMYSCSGWTHFSVEHPLNRHIPGDKSAVNAILRTLVGSENFKDDEIHMTQFEELVHLMAKNHRNYRYGSVLRRILNSAPEYDPLRSSVDVKRVYQFLSHAIKSVIPVELLGGRKNQQTFLKTVRCFIEAGRKTCFTLGGLVHSMQTKKCRWLNHLDSLPHQISLLARLIKWLFMEWIKPLIRGHFYASESTYGRNRVFFYTKDAWQRMSSRMMQSMCSVNLHRQPIAALEKCTSSTDLLADPQHSAITLCSRLRFVPKSSGARPIMSTKFPPANEHQARSARLLLQNISSLYPEGMDAKWAQNLHFKWIDFVRQRDPNAPTYFVHADIEDAFGSICHEKLIDILRSHGQMLPAELDVRMLCYLSPGLPDSRRSKSFPLIPHFHPAGRLAAFARRFPPGSVILDLGSREKLQTAQLIEFAIQCIRHVLVTHIKDQYRLKRGIPQGSRLSSALCHIYYGQMVQEHLSDYLSSSSSRGPTEPGEEANMLIRVVDDFLYLTSSFSRARSFYQRMHQGFPDYRAYVNENKSATNVDLQAATEGKFLIPLPRPAWPSFCGLQFNTRTLELRGDYSRYEGTDIIHCITTSTDRPGILLQQRVPAIATLKIEAMYLDAEINKKPTTVRSMYHACLMAAFRFHAIIRDVMIRQRRNVALDVRFLAHVVIKECCQRMTSHVRNLRIRKSIQICLTKAETSWLCYEAFLRKLRKHQPLYTSLLLLLKEFQNESVKKLSAANLANLQLWIGKGIPRSFRKMKDRPM